MAGPGNDKDSSSVGSSDDPPSLSIALKELGDLPNEVKRWSKDHCPVDILLLTVEDCEFLACYHYLRDSFKSYKKSIGYVYFGKMGEDEDEALKVALVKCSKDSSDPGGSQTAARNAITLLRPKATFLVGFCYSPSHGKTRLGDVVISLKLTTDFHETPVSRDVGNLVRTAAHGWKAPLENPKVRKVKVHCDGEILSCSDLIGARQQCQSHRGAIAVEMEGKGLFATAHDMKMEWLVVKGVCDFLNGSGSTDDSWKNFACVMAASVVSNMLSNPFVFEDWPHCGDGELNIKVEVEDLKLKGRYMQTTTIATETGGCQGFQYQRAAATSPTEGSTSLSGTEDRQTFEARVLASIAYHYLRTTPPQSDEEYNRFLEFMRGMNVTITGFCVGSLLITVKCESLQILEELWTYYSTGHLGEIVQNCFVTEKILEEMNLAELKLKTTIDIEEYKARKVCFERDAPRADIPAEEESCKRDDPSENKPRRLGDISAEESCKSDGPSENKPRRLADTSENNQASTVVPPGEDNKMLPAEDISAGEESCKQDDRSENKRRRLTEPLNVENCQEQLKSYYRTFSKVKIVPWDDSSSIQIDEIYTPLSWVRDHRKPSGVTQEELEDYTDMFKGNPTRILVYGRPGIGKSTFCKKAAYDWSKSLKEIMMNFYILLLIKLRDVCDLEDIRNVLRASKLQAGDGPISVNSLYDYIINNQDKVLLILDGYDEYSCAKEHSPILEIWKGEQLRDCHVIVSTRQIKCDEIRGPSHVQFEIGGIKGWERIKSFARKFLAGEDIQEFMSYLREKDLLDMAEIPLLLVMLCLLWKEKRPEGLPTARANIYTQFIQTMVDHKDESQQPIPFQKVTSTKATEDLSNLGKVAFDALLQDRLYVRCSELPDSISRTFEKLSEVGLFQIVNMTSLNREKGAYFIHKSIQEFLAAWHIKEEVLSIEGDIKLSLSKVDSLEKSFKMNEVLKFACELSTEAACTVFHHLESVGRKESLSEFKFSEPLQSIEDLPEDLQQYLKLISHSYFWCSVEKRRDLLSTFLSLTGGILPLDSNQLNIVANEQLLKCAVIPEFIFFFNEERNSEKSHRDFITLAEHTNAVVLSCSGEKKAAEFLMKYSHDFLDDFFLKKEGKIVLYVCTIRKEGSDNVTMFEMLRELISSTAESTQGKCLGDPLNEHDNQTASSSTEKIDSITAWTPHSLSCTRNISIFDVKKQEMETLVKLLPICSSLREIVITGKPFEIRDAQLTETLVSGIIFTHRLDSLELCEINLTAKPAAAIVRSLHQAPSLRVLALSGNPLGEGVSVLSRHLNYVPHLNILWLYGVKMTKEQVNDLSAAIRQSNISFNTSYHDGKGNVLPEEEWPTDEYWEEELWRLE